MRRRVLVLGLAVLTLYLTSPVVTNFDSYLAVPTAVSLVHDGDLDLDEFDAAPIRNHYGFRRIGSHSYDVYPWTVALLAVPAVVAIDLLHAADIGAGAVALVERNRMGPLQLVLGAVVTTVAVMLVAVLAYERMSGDQPRRRRLALLLGLGFATTTAAWSTASRALWQHGPSMALLALAVLVASRIERGASPRAARSAVVLGATLAAAYAVRPTNAVVAAVIGVWLAVRHRRLVAPFAIGAAVVAGVWVAVNIAAFGSVLPPYHSARRLALHGQFLEAVAANLVSPARGLLVFSPVALLAGAGLAHCWRRRTVTSLDVAVAVAVTAHLLVVSASREGWWAGHAYGPRFMTDVLPLLAWLAVPAVDALGARWATGGARAAAAVLAVMVAWSVVVNAEGAWLRTVHCWNITPTNIDHQPQRVWSLSDPQVLSGLRALVRLPVRQAVLGPCPDAAVEPTVAGAVSRPLAVG